MQRSLGYLATVELWEEQEGAPAPLGGTWVDSIRSWNFALYSQYATAVSLVLFTADDVSAPLREITLDPLVNKTGRVWHVMVP